MAAEGWYGNAGHAQFMANVNRFRAVENRRSVARSSNKGLSLFINSKGQFYNAIPYGSMNMSTADVSTSTQLSFFSRFPNGFPLICIFFIVLILIKPSILNRIMALPLLNH